ncbi:MAG: ribonuclease R [Erysipelotrichaceae bacterium]|nr:ribonuclease R [Erysipelotrichaceae bacterium]
MKEDILELLLNENYHLRKIDELASTLKQIDTREYIAFIKLVNSMEDEGLIIRNEKNQYFLPNQLDYYIGILSMNKKGFGFVKIDEENEIHINEHNLKDAFDKDKVLVKRYILPSGKIEGKIVKVLERGKTRFVGEVSKGRHEFIIKVDDDKMNKWIYVDQAHMHGASVGHKVVVEIKAYKPYLKGDIVKIIGHRDDPGMDILSVVYEHDVDIDFPSDVYDQISTISDEIDQADIKNRVDLRDKTIVTIDGDDAKDFDDAISLSRLDNGHYQLGVHIADVSYYVEEGSPLDKEAVKRGTSIYLVDRVIPMLPYKLSNGICSLNEGVDRYTISCMMEIDEKGQVVSHDIQPTVIRSTHRMTYNNVNKILDGDPILQGKYHDVVDLFFLMMELAHILRRKRDNKGAIDFDVNEGQVVVDKQGKAVDVMLRQCGESEKMIEEFMLLANETVAQQFKWMDLPFIYRVHEQPDSKKLQQFVSMVKPLGYTIKGSLEHIYPNELSAIIEASQGTEKHSVISTLLLRCMQKARYDRECLGHFGLADDFYTHFTSPIRRYPDLLVHRLIRTFLFKQNLSQINHFEEVIPYLAEQSSSRERLAIDIEREVDDMKMAEYMKNHIGEIYEGIISSVTSFGFFVELPNTIDGLVHITELTDDFYNYDEKNMMHIGEHTGKIYKLSDKVKVRVISASKKDKTIDFVVVGKNAKPKRHKIIHVNDRKVKTKRSKNSKIYKSKRNTKRKTRK